MRIHYCPHCGDVLRRDDDGFWCCDTCHWHEYYSDDDD